MPDMLQILHPIFVHFTIALLTTSAVLFLLAKLFAEKSWGGRALAAAFWNLWLGAGITVATVFTGFIAYDAAGIHNMTIRSAMVDHRNWAWATALLCLVVTCWSVVDPRGTGRLPFLGALLLVTGLLTITGWKGGALVYRHGVAVAPVEDPYGRRSLFREIIDGNIPPYLFPSADETIDDGDPAGEDQGP